VDNASDHRRAAAHSAGVGSHAYDPTDDPSRRKRRPPQRSRLLDGRGVVRLVLVAVAAAVTGLLLAGVIGPSAHPIGGAAQLAAPTDATTTVTLTPARPSTPPTSRPRPSPTPSPEQSTDEWSAVLGTLDEARSTALAAGDVAALTAVYVEGSPAYETDRQLVDRMIADGLLAEGVRFSVESVEPLDVGTERAELRVVDRLDPYRIVGADGAVVESPGRGRTVWDVVLVRVGAAWRISEVRRADDQLARAQRSTDATSG
jgi:hypothetical protein